MLLLLLQEAHAAAGLAVADDEVGPPRRQDPAHLAYHERDVPVVVVAAQQRVQQALVMQ